MADVCNISVQVKTLVFRTKSLKGINKRRTELKRSGIKNHLPQFLEKKKHLHLFKGALRKSERQMEIARRLATIFSEMRK